MKKYIIATLLSIFLLTSNSLTLWASTPPTANIKYSVDKNIYRENELITLNITVENPQHNISNFSIMSAFNSENLSVKSIEFSPLVKKSANKVLNSNIYKDYINLFFSANNYNSCLNLNKDLTNLPIATIKFAVKPSYIGYYSEVFGDIPGEQKSSLIAYNQDLTPIAYNVTTTPTPTLTLGTHITAVYENNMVKLSGIMGFDADNGLLLINAYDKKSGKLVLCHNIAVNPKNTTYDNTINLIIPPNSIIKTMVIKDWKNVEPLGVSTVGVIKEIKS